MTSVGAVVIGRNEGDRLVRCLASLQGQLARIVYVDSGSTDDSIAAASAAGAEVVTLDTSVKFTAARARNAGYGALEAQGLPDYVQFIDGDCEVDGAWIGAGAAFLETHPDVAVVAGRQRERFPEATVWNEMIDMEWNRPVGETKACSGNAMMRTQALEEVGLFNPSLIAGEEPELCVRLRGAGWRVYRLADEMVLHDAALTQARQWWQRSRRAGYAYAQGAAMHGGPPERHKVTETRRALLWGAGVPVAALLGALLISPWALLIGLLWPLQMLRLIARGERPLHALTLTWSKSAEALGVFEYWTKRLLNREARLIEYK